VAASAASPMAVLGPGSLTAYWRFQRGVAKAQLAAWLPAGRRLLIDISGPSANCATQAAARGHTVVRVVHGTRAEGTVAPIVPSAIPASRDTGRETGRGYSAGDAAACGIERAERFAGNDRIGGNSRRDGGMPGDCRGAISGARDPKRVAST